MEEVMSDQVYRNPIPNYGFQTLHTLTEGLNIKDYLTLEDLHKDLMRGGALIIKGFSDDVDHFNSLIECFSRKVTKDPARKSSTQHTAEIKAGVEEMGLHRENGNLPYCPDIQWFYCMQPAAKGSETTLCDGEQVYQKMAPEVRRLFESNLIKYDRLIPWDNVKSYLSVELEKPFESVGYGDLEYVNEIHPGQKYSVFDRNLVKSERFVSAIQTSIFSGRQAFCNSLLGPSFNYEPPKITWEDGSQIDIRVFDEVRRVTESLTYDHFWEEGDMMVVDNSRVMHGRRYLEDPKRRIFGAQSYIKGV